MLVNSQMVAVYEGLEVPFPQMVRETIEGRQMTIEDPRVTIYCDNYGRDCKRYISFLIGWGKQRQAVLDSLNVSLTSDGWDAQGDRHLCPTCKAG